MNVAITRAAEGFPRRAFSVDDLRRMIDIGVIGEDEKFELIEGEIVMAAAKGIVHERIKAALVRAIAPLLPDDLDLGVEATLRLSETTMLEPDMAVFPRTVLRHEVSGFAQLDPGEARLVIEVAASSMVYDKTLKARLYARHGVREYWVIDAAERVTYVHTGPGGDGWSSIVEKGPQETLTTAAVPGLSIRLDDID